MKYVMVSDIVCKVSIKGSRAGSKVFPSREEVWNLKAQATLRYFLSVYQTTWGQVCDPFLLTVHDFRAWLLFLKINLKPGFIFIFPVFPVHWLAFDFTVEADFFWNKSENKWQWSWVRLQPLWLCIVFIVKERLYLYPIGSHETTGGFSCKSQTEWLKRSLAWAMVPMRTCSHEDRPVPVVTACPLEKRRLPPGWQQSSGSTAPGDGCSRTWHAWVGFHWATYRPAGTDMCFEFSIMTQWNHMDRHSFLWNQLAFWQPHELLKEGTPAPCCPRSTGGLREELRLTVSDSHPGLYFPIKFTKVKSMWFNSCAKMNEDGRGTFVFSDAPALCSWFM